MSGPDNEEELPYCLPGTPGHEAYVEQQRRWQNEWEASRSPEEKERERLMAEEGRQWMRQVEEVMTNAIAGKYTSWDEIPEEMRPTSDAGIWAFLQSAWFWSLRRPKGERLQ